MLNPKNLVYKELKTTLELLCGSDFQVLNGDYLSELKSEDTQYNHCVYTLDNFRDLKIYTKNTKPSTKDGFFSINKYQVFKCSLEITVIGDSLITLETIQKIASMLSHEEYVNQNLPSISIIGLNNVRSGSVNIGGNSLSLRKLNIDCSIEDVAKVEVGYFDKVENKMEVKNNG